MYLNEHYNKLNYNMDTMKIKNRNIILLIGIGILGFLSITSFAFLFRQIAKEIFFHLSTNSVFTVWTIELIRFGICIGGILLLIKIVSITSKSDIVMFRNVFILLLIAQILQFLWPFISNTFMNENYLIIADNYNVTVNENYFYMGLPSYFGLLTYLLIALIIFLHRKQQWLTKAKMHDTNQSK